MKKDYAATSRNRDPILKVLKRVLPKEGLILEIASGTGQHGLYFAEKMKSVRWQPTDSDPEMLASIRAWREESGLDNLLEPIALDVMEPWPVSRVDAIFNANMIHISPWPCTEALMRGSRRALSSAGLLVMYGPFMLGGQHTAPSNRSFDDSLRARNPEWGVRDLDEVRSLAAKYALEFLESVQMPANNQMVIFRRR